MKKISLIIILIFVVLNTSVAYKKKSRSFFQERKIEKFFFLVMED